LKEEEGGDGNKTAKQTAPEMEASSSGQKNEQVKNRGSQIREVVERGNKKKPGRKKGLKRMGKGRKGLTILRMLKGAGGRLGRGRLNKLF